MYVFVFDVQPLEKSPLFYLMMSFDSEIKPWELIAKRAVSTEVGRPNLNGGAGIGPE